MKNPQSTVYVIQEQHYLDYRDAERFGELSFVTSRNYPNQPNSIMAKQMPDTIARSLKGFNANSDYILFSGDPAMIFAFGCCLMKLGIDTEYFNVLKWDGQLAKYIDFKIFI